MSSSSPPSPTLVFLIMWGNTHTFYRKQIDRDAQVRLVARLASSYTSHPDLTVQTSNYGNLRYQYYTWSITRTKDFDRVEELAKLELGDSDTNHYTKIVTKNQIAAIEWDRVALIKKFLDIAEKHLVVCVTDTDKEQAAAAVTTYKKKLNEVLQNVTNGTIEIYDVPPPYIAPPPPSYEASN